MPRDPTIAEERQRWHNEKRRQTYDISRSQQRQQRTSMGRYLQYKPFK